MEKGTTNNLFAGAKGWVS